MCLGPVRYGEYEAQMDLAEAYLKCGNGWVSVEKSVSEAIYWYTKAKDQGNRKAAKVLDKIAKQRRSSVADNPQVQASVVPEVRALGITGQSVNPSQQVSDDRPAPALVHEPLRSLE